MASRDSHPAETIVAERDGKGAVAKVLGWYLKGLMWKAQIDPTRNVKMANSEGNMARGMTPRRPAKTGRHERAGAKLRAENLAKPKATRKEVPRSAQVSKQRVANNSKGTKGKTAGYNPVTPARVSEILKRLDQLYPDVTCVVQEISNCTGRREARTTTA